MMNCVLLFAATVLVSLCATSASRLRAVPPAAGSVHAAEPPRVLWQTGNLSVVSLGRPVAANGRIFAVGADASNASLHRVFAFDPLTGATLWALIAEGVIGSVAASSEVVDDAVLFVGTDSGLVAYTQSNGTRLWSFVVPAVQRFSSLSAKPGQPVYRGGVLYCTWSNTPLVALDAVTGVPLQWTTAAADGAVFLSHAGTHAWFVAVDPVTMVRSATCVDARNMTAVVWVVLYNTNTTRLIANEYGVIVVSTPYPNNGAVERLQSLNPNNGDQNWDAYLAGYSGAATTSQSTFNFALDQVYFAFPTAANAWAVRCKCLFVETDHWDLNIEVTTGANGHQNQNIDTRRNRDGPTESQLSLASFYAVTFLHNYDGGQLWAVDSIMGNVLWQWNVPSPSIGLLQDHGYYFFGSGATLVAVAVF